MDFPVELLINAIVAGLLLGGFYAAVTAGPPLSLLLLLTLFLGPRFGL